MVLIVLTTNYGCQAPLNDAIISAHHLVSKFKKVKRLDIVNTVFLTDGEGFTATIRMTIMSKLILVMVSIN